MLHPTFKQTTKSSFLLMTLLWVKICNLSVTLFITLNPNTWTWSLKPCPWSNCMHFSGIFTTTYPFIPMHQQEYAWRNIYYTPVGLSMSRCGPAPSSSLSCSDPQATLFCSILSVFKVQPPAQVPLPLWSLLFFQVDMTSPSLALHTNHFYHMSPSLSVLLFCLSHLPQQPVCFLPAGCCVILTSLVPFIARALCCTTVWLSSSLLMFYCWHVLCTINWWRLQLPLAF